MESGVSSTRAAEKKPGTRGARGPTKKNEPQADEKSLRPKRDAKDSDELAADFKVLPMAERGSGENEPEQEGGRREIPGLVGEGKPIILGVE